MCKADIDACEQLDVHMINLSIPVSDIHLAKKLKRDRAWVLDTIFEMVPYAYDLRPGSDRRLRRRFARRSGIPAASGRSRAGRRRAPHPLCRHAGRDGTVRRAQSHFGLAQRGGHRDRDARARRSRPGHRQQSCRRRGGCHAYQHHGERSGRTRGQCAAGRSRAWA